MFRKLVIIGIVMGLAGMAMAMKRVGDPSSSNGWSTTSSVTVKTCAGTPTWNGSSWDWPDPSIYETWTKCYDHNLDEKCLINGLGLDPNTGMKHSTADWLGGVEDGNSQYTSTFVMYNASGSATVHAPKYDPTNMMYEWGLWFAFEFNQSYYIGDILIWNFNDVPSSISTVRKPTYAAKVVRISYTDGSGSYNEWREPRQITLDSGNGRSWTRGEDGLYPQLYPLDANAKVVVLTFSHWGATANKGPGGMSEVHFEKDPNRATDFKPRPWDITKNWTTVSVDKFANLPLSWKAGKGSNIVKHKVYISTDVNAVINRTAAGTIVTQNSYATSGLVDFTYYYWTVDELDDSNNVVAEGSGRPMRIRPIPVASIDDFDSYTDLYHSNFISNTWKGGWSTQYYNSGDEKTHYLNGALADVARTNNSTSVSRYMAVQYDNDGMWNYPDLTPWGPIDHNYSEVTAKAEDLTGGKDWISAVGGNGSIWLNVRGSTSNDSNGPLFMIITDGSGHSASSSFAKYNPAGWLKGSYWNWWFIDIGDFTGVDFTDVNTVTLRIGDGTGHEHGTIYFDDFRLYAPLCSTSSLVPDTEYWPGTILGIGGGEQGDVNGDCMINMKDVAIIANNWLLSGDAP